MRSPGSPARVIVEDVQGRRFEAAGAILAVPLGVLQHGQIRLDPMPEALVRGLAAMRMGVVCRFTLVLARRLWPAGMSFLLTPGLLPSVWWTANPAESLTLTGWVGGPRAEPMLRLAEADLRRHALAALAEALALPLEEVEAALTGFHTLDWQAEPTARGAYSWVPVGGLEDSGNLSQPVAHTIFLAGEHTDTTGHWGTVHAAYRSGLRAAGQITAGQIAAGQMQEQAS